MGDIIMILIAMFAVFGFYSALYELRAVLRRLARRYSKKIDNQPDMEYNNSNKD